MNLFKRTTASVALVSLVSGVFSVGVSAFDVAELNAASALAAKGYINFQSNVADYNLDSTITRAEIAKVAANVAELDASALCEGNFADVSATTPNDWVCGYVEPLLAGGFISANVNYNPNANLTKAEAVKLMLEVAGQEVPFSDATWQADFVSYAVENGFVSTFTDFNTAATRGFTFSIASAATTEEVEVEVTDNIIQEIQGLLNGTSGDDTTSVVEEDEDDIVIVSGDNVLSIELSPRTPASATIPGFTNGVRAAAYDVTAGSEDVTISQIAVKRTGLSDEDTLDQLAIFTDAGRASNAQSDNQDNDTVAQINLDDGGLVVKAGETTTIYVVVDVESSEDADGDTFAIEIEDVRANSSDVNFIGSLRGNTMEIGSIDAPILIITPSGSVSNPNLGEEQADIFEFEIEGADDEDVILRSITFEANGDAEDNLENFELKLQNDVVATTARMNGDYLTFTFGDEGLVIEEDKNEDFTVRADIIDGAGEGLAFRIDERLDVQADSTKFGFGASADINEVDEFADASNENDFLGFVLIEAGELTLIEVEADLDEIREDKDNIILAGFEVVNLSGDNLELEEFGVTIALVDTSGTSFVDFNGNGLEDTADFLAAHEVFEDVELFNTVTGSSYDLDAEDEAALISIFSDNNIDAPINSGTTLWQIRADTAEDIVNFEEVSISIDVNVDADIRVVETDDDERVTDITPGTLSFNTIDGSESGADISLISLADLDVVRGADDVEALAFEVEADESSDIVVDELTVRIEDGNGNDATRQQISAIRLFAESITSANELDVVSGSDIGSNGDVTFDDMEDYFIEANDEVDFFVTISFVDADDTVTGSNGNVGYTVSLAEISIDDDENDDVTVIGANSNGAVLSLSDETTHFVSGRQLVVNNAGQIVTLELDDANEDNEFDKLALAGESTVIASYDVRADNEEVDIEIVEFTLSHTNATDILPRDIIENASILLDGVVVEVGSNSDISSASTASGGTFTITFEDLEDLILPETTTELGLQLNTANIGDDFTGLTTLGLVVTNVTFDDAEGVDSGEDLDSGDIVALTGGNSRSLDIVPAVVTPSVVSTFGSDDQTAELRLTVQGGNNTTDDGAAVQAELEALTFVVSSGTAADGDISVFNGNGTLVWTNTGSVVTINNPESTDDSDSIGNDNEVYRIEVGQTAEAIYRLATDGVTYDVNNAGTQISTRLENTLELGQYTDTGN